MDRRSFFITAPMAVATYALPTTGSAAAPNAKLADIIDFGADPTGSADSTQAIQAAIDSLGGSGSVIAPPGTYRCSASIFIRASSVSIIGQSRSSTVFRFPPGSSGFIVSAGTNNVEIRSLQISSVNAAMTAGSTGVSAVSTSLSNGLGIGYLTIVDVDINGFDKGVNVQYAQLCGVDRCHIWANKIGYYSKRCVNMRLNSTILELNSTWGAFIDGDASAVSYSAGTLMKDCTLVNCGGSTPTNTGTLHVAYNEYTSVIGCMIDVPSAGSQWHLLFNGCARGCIMGNWIGAAASPRGGISLVGSSEISISGNNVLTSQGYGIGLENSRHNTVTSNVLRDNVSVDIIVFGTSGVGNNISSNICLSTTNSNSIGETGPFKTLAVGNSVAKGILLSTASGSLSANNLSIT